MELRWFCDNSVEMFWAYRRALEMAFTVAEERPAEKGKLW